MSDDLSHSITHLYLNPEDELDVSVFEECFFINGRLVSLVPVKLEDRKCFAECRETVNNG